MRKKRIQSALACLLAAVMIITVTGCGNSQNGSESLTYEDALKELQTLSKSIKVNEVSNPVMDIYSDESSDTDVLDDISAFPLSVEGNGDITIEIASATEMSSEAPDDWLNVVADQFNKEKRTIDGQTVAVSVRKIASGEILTYMDAGKYKPQAIVPSNEAWGKMIQASGISTEKLADRIAGNTAGLLIKKDVYDSFIKKYKKATVDKVLEASIAGDLTFAYTNPYTSSTGLNILTAMLKSFDEENPLSEQASSKLLEYQKTSPPVAYTTSVLRNQAAKGLINAMVMEEQAYINTPELKDYKYIPAGIRHDHPVYTFDYVSDAEKQAAQMFVEYCQSEDNQKLAEEKGFNRHDDYVSEDPGLDGAGYLAAQKVWKQNKNGGNPILAVFIADVSGSMEGEPLKSLKNSLINASSSISSDNYIGLVSYSSDVTINLPVEQFDSTQKAYFSGEVKKLNANGATATYDAVLTGLKMLHEKAEEVPNAKLMLFVLTDGAQNEGYSLERITPIVDGLEVPVYSIAYNYNDDGELEKLSEINEAAFLQAETDDISNQLRNLFNAEI